MDPLTLKMDEWVYKNCSYSHIKEHQTKLTSHYVLL